MIILSLVSLAPDILLAVVATCSGGHSLHLLTSGSEAHSTRVTLPREMVGVLLTWRDLEGALLAGKLVAGLKQGLTNVEGGVTSFTIVLWSMSLEYCFCNGGVAEAVLVAVRGLTG